MKTLISKFAITASCIAILATTALQANAQDKLVYHKAINTSIGITVENAVGAEYVIKDSNGNIAYRGKVKSDKTFYIPTAKLGTGAYRFYIGNLSLQEFVIR